jgi:hypothetical protein
LKVNVSDTASMLGNRFARDTASLSSRIDLKANIADTSTMLNPYLRKADTTSMLSNRFARDTASLSNRINLKVNISDTASMLSNRFARDTASLSSRIDLKANIADTSTMLNPYLRKADTTSMLSNRFARDTASLSNRINLKLTAADTASLSRRIDSLRPLSSGDIVYGGTNGIPTRLAKGADGQVLQLSSGLPVWAASTSITEVSDEFTATAAQTTFTISHAKGTNRTIKMYINGIRISNTAYSDSSTTVTYNSANNDGYTIAAGDRIQFDFSY